MNKNILNLNLNLIFVSLCAYTGTFLFTAYCFVLLVNFHDSKLRRHLSQYYFGGNNTIF
jgi:hypothetical protein